MTRKISTFPFAGGLDLESAAIAVPPGALISGLNYEVLAEGYGRVKGYERFDGQVSPSAVSYYALAFDAGSGAISAGDTVTGATSGATGIVITEPEGLTGSWAGGDAAGTLVLGAVGGTFVDGENLQVSAVTKAVADGAAVISGGASDTEIRTRQLATMAWQRTNIGKVPGQDAVRGVAVHDGVVYAWRDNVGATKLKCYKATSTGWVEMGEIVRIPFTTGLTAFALGSTVTGGTSGASGTIVNVSGTTTTGFIDVASITGTFVTGEALQVSAVTKATAGVPASQYPAPGGRVRWLSHNFYGSSDLYRLYGANGTGQAFEIIPASGMTLIDTGMADDRPQRIFEINNHLGLTFPGGSVQFSGTLDPHAWSVILGAGEIGFGTDVTDVLQANETAVAIFGVSKIAMLQGRDSSDFVLDTLTEEAGAEPDSAQRIATTVYLDRRGLRSLSATQQFGNFKTGTLTGKIERYFRAKRDAGVTLLGSYVVKSKQHYRMIWSDKTGLSVYLGGRQPEAMLFAIEDTPYCFGGGELADGEGVFFGGEDGYVYRMESGNNHDGEPITGFVMTGFNHFGAPEREDRFFKVVLELETPASANIAITAQFNYGDGSQPINGESEFWVTGGAGDFLVDGGGGVWDGATWDSFYWSSAVEGRAEAPLDSVGRNASFIFATTADLDENPHTLQAYAVHHRPGKVQR